MITGVFTSCCSGIRKDFTFTVHSNDRNLLSGKGIQVMAVVNF